MIKKIILGLVSLGFILSITGCGTQKVVNIPNQTITEKVSSADVLKAIQRAGAGLGWIVKEVDGSNATAILNLRRHQAIVDIAYSAKDYSITYKSSQALKYDPAENTIHKNYNSWIRNLDNAIQMQLNLL